MAAGNCCRTSPPPRESVTVFASVPLLIRDAENEILNQLLAQIEPQRHLVGVVQSPVVEWLWLPHKFYCKSEATVPEAATKGLGEIPGSGSILGFSWKTKLIRFPLYCPLVDISGELIYVLFQDGPCPQMGICRGRRFTSKSS